MSREAILSKIVSGKLKCPTCPYFDEVDKDCKRYPKSHVVYDGMYCGEHPLLKAEVEKFLKKELE